MINVMIVEDDPMVIEFNKRYLHQVEGFSLQAVARSIPEAIAVLDKYDIHLILLDIYMPGSTGLEFLSQIRESGRGVDVIMVSAASDIHAIKKALHYGAIDYLIKPFEFERFRLALTAYRERHGYIKQKMQLSQTDLDQFILQRKEEQASFKPLPKGLDKHTLQKVWSQVLAMEHDFSTSEIARYVGISRVSMRKYLDFLQTIGMIRVELSHGSIGRPIYKYRYLGVEDNYIRQYL